MQVQSSDENKIYLLCDKRDISIADAVSYPAQNYVIRDIQIQDSDVESILKKMYQEKEMAL
jgi:ABC-type uncharacterized transport system ATPase subunit